jgi:hypothetical protein
MKLGILAVSALVGVASLAPAASAQGDLNVHMSRTAQTEAAGAAAFGVSTNAAAVRPLESARPAAGMLPQQPTGPVQGTSGLASNQAVPGGDIRNALSRE